MSTDDLLENETIEVAIPGSEARWVETKIWGTTSECVVVHAPAGYDHATWSLLRSAEGRAWRRRPKATEHDHTVLTRGCQVCLDAARAMTPEQRFECMALLQSLDTPSRAWWTLPMLVRTMTALRCVSTAHDAVVWHRHEQNGHTGRVETCGEPECQEHVEIHSETLALLKELETAAGRFPDQVKTRGIFATREQEQATAAPDTLAADLAAARSANDALRRDQTAIMADKNEFAKRAIELGQELETMRLQLAEARKANDALNQANQGLHTTLATERRELQSVKDELTNASRTARLLREDVEASERQLTEVRESLTGASDVLDYVGRALGTAIGAHSSELEDVRKRASRAAELTKR